VLLECTILTGTAAAERMAQRVCAATFGPMLAAAAATQGFTALRGAGSEGGGGGGGGGGGCGASSGIRLLGPPTVEAVGSHAQLVASQAMAAAGHASGVAAAAAAATAAAAAPTAASAGGAAARAGGAGQSAAAGGTVLALGQVWDPSLFPENAFTYHFHLHFVLRSSWRNTSWCSLSSGPTFSCW
jgi:hypothetical protein